VTQQPARRAARPGSTSGALFRVVGVPVVVSPSWLLIGLLLSAVYGPVLQDAAPRISTPTAYLAAVAYAVAFGACVLAHEIGHTLVSIALGHPVRRIVLFALGGVSEIDSEPERPRDELLIAAAGPLVSLLIAGLAAAGWSAAPGGTLLAALLALLFWSNLVLALFNLLPGLPLDGGRLLRAAVCAFGVRPVPATRVAAWSGRLVAVGLFVSGVLLDRTTAGLAAAVFTAALAAYLWYAAGRAQRVAELLSSVPDIRLTDLLRPGMFVPQDVTVAEAFARAWNAQARGVVLVDRADRPVAIVDEARAGAVPLEQRPWTPVTAVARPLEPGLTLPDDLDGPALLRRIQTTPAREYLVVHRDGRAAGILSAADVARHLRAAR
jgi:Zn-dependent protease